MIPENDPEPSLREIMLMEALKPFALIAEYTTPRHDPIFKTNDASIRAVNFHKAKEVFESLAPDIIKPNDVGHHYIYGDWRDIKSAIIDFDPHFNTLPEETKDLIWKYVNGTIENFNRLFAKCGPFGCGKIVPIRNSYKCSDCHGRYCEDCITPHFGPTHVPHR